jgi:predicted dehydrogenase
MTSPVRLGLIGLGRWGRKYIETIGEMPGAKLDIAVGSKFADDVFHLDRVDPRLDGLIIATGPDSHCALAAEGVRHDIPVMVEKPLALKAADVVRLQEACDDVDGPLVLVDHTPLFDQRYVAIVARATDCPVTSVDIEWTGPGSHDGYSPLHDYGAHAVAMALNCIGPGDVERIECSAHTGGPYQVQFDCASARVHASVGCTSSRFRGMRIVNARAESFVYNEVPADGVMPLRHALDAFVQTIRGKPDPRCGLALALRVTRVLEECASQCEET